MSHSLLSIRSRDARNLTKLWQDAEEQERDQAVLNTYTPPRSGAGSRDSSGYGATAQDSIHGSIENEPLLRLLSRSSLYQQPHQQPPIVSSREFDTESLWQTIRNILDRCFQPPVMGAIAGILVAITPGARGIFVDLVDRNSSAPLQFFFDALYTVGETAVPINMMILGCNLSSSISKPTTALKSDEFPGNGRSNSEMLSMKSMIGIVIGKMIVMPMIGILSALILKTYVLDIPADIDGAFYLVLMILFLTPTANNLIIMVELSGSGAKEGMARVIALQYLVAPVILSLTMTIAIGVASGWSS